jgi:hypothetical protein
MAPHPPDPLGLLLVAMSATVVVTPALSLLVLWHHRRAVGRSVHSRARRLPVAAPPVPVGAPAGTYHRVRPAPVVRLDAAHRPAGGGPPDDLWRRARRRLHATVTAYVVAGLACGLVDGAVWLTAGRVEIGPRNLLGLMVLFAWPLVPTVLSVLAASRSTRVQVWVGYGVLVPLSTIGTGITPSVTVVLIGVVVVPPALALLTLSGPAFHAVGPFLATPVLLTATGLFLYPSTARWAVWFGASAEVGTFLAVLATALIGLAGAGHLVRSARQYARKRAGDQTVTISQWWLFATAWHCVVLVPSGVRAALAVWTAHLVFRLVLAAAMRLRPRPVDPPHRLLLLRTPGARRYGGTLLNRLGAYWSHVGTISTIATTDVAYAALEPREFLDLLRGRPARPVIENAGELRKRVVEIDQDPDPDGGYRVNQLFCHDDLWREALQELVRRSDCILVDLRGFTRAHERVAADITQLTQLAPLSRILVLVDDDTDQYFLRTTVDRAHTGAGGSLRLMRSGGRHLDTATVVEQLAAGSARTA